MLLRQDELNNLKGNLARYKGDLNKINELLYDWQLLAYSDGKTDAEQQLGKSVNTDLGHIESTINAKVGGKTAVQRTKEYFYLEDYEAIINAFENERKRIYNIASFNAAKELEAETKTWHCMMLPESRDTHIYLDGIEKPIDEYFSTYNGDSALYPRGFGEAEEDINCLCYLTFK